MKKILLGLVFIQIALYCLGQPANDEPCGSHLVIPTPLICQSFEDNNSNSVTSVLNATTTLSNNVMQFDCDFNPAPGIKDVWFKIPMNESNLIIKANPIAGFDVSMQAYYKNSGSCITNDFTLSFLQCGSAEAAGFADSISIPGFYNSFIDTIYLRVFHYPDGTGPSPINNSQFSICAYYPMPGCVTNSFPADAQQLIFVESLQWGFDEFASSYDVYLGPTILTANFIGNTQNTSFDISTLNLVPGTYFWYVVPKNGNISATGCSTNATSFIVTPAAENNLICNAKELIPSNIICTPFVDNNTISSTSYFMSTYEGGLFGSGVACGFGASITADVWFKFTANDSAFHTVKIMPVAGINTSFRVYRSSASCNGSFTQIGCYNSGTVAVADTGVFITSPGKQYYIQVFSQNGSTDFNPPGNSQFGICIVKHPPVCQVPLLISPANGAINIDHLNSFISWNNVSGTSEYDLYVGNSAASLAKVPYTVIQSVSNTKRINFQANFLVNSPFAPGFTYFWKIVPRNGTVTNLSCVEEIRSFTTSSCPNLFAFGIDFPIISGTHAGELDYKMYCANCPNVVLEYGPTIPFGNNNLPGNGNFIVYPAQPISSTNAYGTIGIDSTHQISSYRYNFRLNGCPVNGIELLPFNPGLPVVVNSCQDTKISIYNGKGRWDFNGQYPVNSNSNSTPGKMSWFNYTPTESGVYYLQVDSVELNEPVDYLYKPDSLNKFSAAGWTGISEISAKGKYVIGYLSANVLYHFVADRQDDTTITTIPGVGLARHFIKICKAELNAPIVLNTCIDANIRKPIPAFSPKEEFAIDSSGRLIASIKAGNDSLGLVNVSYYVNGNGLRYDANGREYLDRNFTITPSRTVTSTQEIKLFFTNDELTNLINAPDDGNADVTSINDLMVTKSNQTCLTSSQIGNNGNVFITPTEKAPFNTTSGFVKLSVSSFSTFYLHGGSNFILPLKFLEFTVKKSNRMAELSWKSENEINTSHFIVERSINGSSYTSIGTVSAFNISAVHRYGFIDAAPISGTNYYRLKQVDRDHRFSYSDVRVIDFGINNTSIRVYPSFTDAFFNVSGLKSGMKLDVFDALGKILISKNIFSEIEIMDISRFTSGTYFLRITQDSQTISTFKILKY